MNAITAKLPDTQASIDQSLNRDQLIMDHLHLVTVIASHVQNSLPVHMELDDLVHAGTMGLFDAATKYRDDKEVAFPTYAKHRIRGAILDSMRQQDWASRDLRKRYKQVAAVKAELTAKLGHAPTEAEIASALGLTSKRWQALMVDFRSLSAVALQTHSHENDEQLAPEIPAAPAQAPDRLFAQSELRSKLATAMKTLPERYQQVVSMYYEKDLNMKEIGTLLGVKESRVSQIHKSALQRMQMVLGGVGICSAAAF